MKHIGFKNKREGKQNSDNTAWQKSDPAWYLPQGHTEDGPNLNLHNRSGSLHKGIHSHRHQLEKHLNCQEHVFHIQILDILNIQSLWYYYVYLYFINHLFRNNVVQAWSNTTSYDI
jgi:hypothetical protein